MRSQNQSRGKLLLSRKLCYFRGSRFSQCFILRTCINRSPLLNTKEGFVIPNILSNYQQGPLPLMVKKNQNISFISERESLRSSVYQPQAFFNRQCILGQSLGIAAYIFSLKKICVNLHIDMVQYNFPIQAPFSHKENALLPFPFRNKASEPDTACDPQLNTSLHSCVTSDWHP